MRTCLHCGQKTEAPFCMRDGTATVVHGRRPANWHLENGTLFAGRYRIVAELGRGGMGAVYEALHTGTSQPVAIKTLLLDADGDEDAARRFFQEARICAGLQHPNTIRVFDFGQSDDGVFYLAMERLRGHTLAEHLRMLARRGHVPGEDEATRIACSVLRSLAEAHGAGLVHRDLKPMNVFLHEVGGELLVKVLDFGIARCADSGLTRTGMTVGTPSYMSPEQVLNRSVDGRADLYALGVILYGCVAGQLPFSGDSSYALMMKHVDEAPPDLRPRLRRATSEDFIAIVERALAKNPDDRFGSAREMRGALERVVTQREAGLLQIHAPVARANGILAPDTHAASSSTWPQPREWLRRRSVWVAATGAAMTIATGLAAVHYGLSRPAVPAKPLQPVVVSVPSALPPAVAPSIPALPPVAPPAGPATQPVPLADKTAPAMPKKGSQIERAKQRAAPAAKKRAIRARQAASRKAAPESPR